MNYNRFETVFNAVFPLPFKAIIWLCIAFVVSAILDGWKVALGYALSINTLFFNIMLIVSIRNYILYRKNLSAKGLVKVLLSVIFFIAFNVILLLTTTWKYSIALFLIPIPVLILFYLLFKRLKVR
jgi:hypothetical protein